MKKENTVAFRVDIFEDSPRNTYHAIEPKNHINSAWIGQTLADQVWIWFEFENYYHKEEYILQLPKKYHKMFMHNEPIFTQDFVDRWIHKGTPKL